MKKLYLLFYCFTLSASFSFIGFNAVSQTSVKIIDLAVVPLLASDTTNQQDTTILNVIFKVKNKGLSNKAYYLFGTVSDSSDIFLTQGLFLNQGGTTYLQTNGTMNEVVGYNAMAIFKLDSLQNSNFHYITVFVEDNYGQITDKLYFQK